MSHYVAQVGIVKIKPEYIEPFRYMYNGEYDKVTDEIFIRFINDYCIDDEYKNASRDISKWKHGNEKKDWIGKYETSYLDGVFTYGISYNEYNHEMFEFVDSFMLELLFKIKKQVIFRDIWEEP